jgi:hypothetical protein
MTPNDFGTKVKVFSDVIMNDLSKPCLCGAPMVIATKDGWDGKKEIPYRAVCSNFNHPVPVVAVFETLPPDLRTLSSYEPQVS